MKNFLIIQLRQLGDILLTTPVPVAIKDELPGTRVVFLCHRMGLKVLAGNPFIDRILVYDDSHGFKDFVKLVATMRSERFDVAIDYMNNPRSALLTRLSGAKKRLAFSSARGWAYNVRVPRPQEDDYIVREKFLLLKKLGLSPKKEGLTLPIDRNDGKRWADFLDSGLPRRLGPCIALSPTHRRAARRWPLASFSELADRLTREWEADVIWVWGPDEEAVVDECISLCETQTFKLPRTSVRELAACLAGCDLFIGNSNGPSHFAVAMGTPSLQLHGPTIGTAWCPMEKSHFAIQSPTEKMSDISLADVWSVITKMRASGALQRN